MNSASRPVSIVLLFSLLFSFSASSGWAQYAAAPSTSFDIQPDNPAQPAIYPQIVRVSLVEGDVRVSRGKDGEKADGAAWEKAAVDLPLESGFSLVTGAGRAEVEFENASTIYLADNSVLVFNELSTTNARPHTELALLSGTMTLNVKPARGEWFAVRTPVDSFLVPYPSTTYLRVNSYLDGMTVTPLGATMFRTGGQMGPRLVGEGETVTFRGVGKQPTTQPADKSAFADWDEWVGLHVVERDQAMRETMKQAGLSMPLPGLAEMKDQGTFYPCAPYGTCWEPNDQGAAQAQAKPEDPAVKAELAKQTVSVNTLQQSGGKLPVSNQAAPAVYGGGSLLAGYDDFPCLPWWQRNSLYWIDPATGLLTGNPYRYQWAVCHTGSWIARGQRYVWVVGIKRHHHHPVHWVKTGKAVGFVPIHPRDVAGKPPLNLKNGLMKPDKDGAVEKIAYEDGEKVKLLDEAPKAFRNDEFPRLERAEEPHAMAYRVSDRAMGAAVDSKLIASRPVGVPVTFDHKSQSFMVAQTVEHGGATRTVAAPIGGRGVQPSASASGGSMARGGGGGYSGGGASRGSSGGSSGGGGGASHASASSSSASSSSASSGGGGASSGGGKH